MSAKDITATRLLLVLLDGWEIKCLETNSYTHQTNTMQSLEVLESFGAVEQVQNKAMMKP